MCENHATSRPFILALITNRTAKDIKPNNPDDKAEDTKADTDSEDRKAERKTQVARVRP